MARTEDKNEAIGDEGGGGVGCDDSDCDVGGFDIFHMHVCYNTILNEYHHSGWVFPSKNRKSWVHRYMGNVLPRRHTNTHPVQNIPLLPRGDTRVVLTWDQLRKLGETNHRFLDKVTFLELCITERDTVTVDSLVLLHEWAGSNVHERRLQLSVQHWTVAMQTVFVSACCQYVIYPLFDGLDSFDFLVHRIEPRIFEFFDPITVVWHHFVSPKTDGHMHLNVPDATTPFTVPWLRDLLQIFQEFAPRIVPHLDFGLANQ